MQYVKLVNEALLRRFASKRRDAGPWLNKWAAIVAGARWHNIIDVRRDFPSADGVRHSSGLVITVFNVRGNEYRLLTHVEYAGGSVRVLDVLTHAEYDRDKWKG
jgi:mRNA interferase HigB